ncbi:MspA family porin [Mycolicibacterium sp. PAM1]|uniref:MspA family porin n=1 Tax=Mycolicibacterium sp. PAM1 TaxID=2853535 RepID=UPI001C3C3098|nr:MspA family porin [Mycolicibacterium sp. PAM1]MBV5246305.1 MspA family porin [Mycolicibacterium sp. PAM1]
MRVAATAAVAVLGLAGATSASAQPDPVSPVVPGVQAVADVGPPPAPDGAVASGPPGFVVTPDGWELTVSAKDEFQVAVAPLTTALSSREYLVAGTFEGAVAGAGTAPTSGGTLEVGYQIGCGISLNVVKLNGSAGFTPSINDQRRLGVAFPVSAQIEVFPQPGEVTTVQLTQKTFEGSNPRVTVKDVHIKVDGCVGESFLRSYAVLTSSTDAADDIVAYYGVTKAV